MHIDVDDAIGCGGQPRRALRILQRRLGSAHPHVAIAMDNLALLRAERTGAGSRRGLRATAAEAIES